MRYSTPEPERLARDRVELDSGTAVTKVAPGPANKTGRKAKREKLVKETTVPNRIKRPAKVNTGKNSSLGRLGRVETVRDGLGKEENLVKSRASRPETSLKARKKAFVLDEEDEPSQDHPLEDSGKTRGERDGSIRRRVRGGFTSLEHGHNVGKPPGRREDAGRPRVVENREESGASKRREVGEKGVGETSGVTGGGRRDRGKRAFKLSKGKGGAESHGVGARSGADREDKAAVRGAVRLRDGSGEVRRIVPSKLLGLTLGSASTLNGGIGGRLGRKTRDRTKKAKGGGRIGARKRRGHFLPGFRLGIRNDRAGRGRGRFIEVRPSGRGRSLQESI